jgi:hypothetical protein
MAADANGETLICADEDGVVMRWSLDSSKLPERIFTAQTDFRPQHLAITGDGRLIAAASSSEIRVSDGATETVVSPRLSGA